ncbi:MAG: hypothetical protein NVS2B7_27610 [Herpetosiphon sp.]
MEPSPLRSTLEQLDTEIKQTTVQEPERAQTLQGVQGKVQQLLTVPETVLPEHRHSLIEELRGIVPTLEATHPQLTNTMSQVVDMLDRMGI